MSALEFATPAAFALLPAPLLLAFARRAPSAAGGLLLPRALRERLRARGGDGAKMRLSFRFAAAVFAWIGLVAALAGPRVADAVAALPAAGRDIVLVLDLSGSMTKRDFELDGVAVSRIDLVKRAGEALIRRREGDRIGLVVFAETAYAAAPLSFDTRAVARALREMEIGIVGRSTAIGDGLGLALKRLSQSTAPARIVILLSDGANNAGAAEPAAVAALAPRLGVRIFTIGLGVEDATTRPDDADAVDFAALQRLAQIGGGEAFRVRVGAELDAAARAIEALAAAAAPAPPVVIYREYWTFAAAGAFLAVALITLGARTPR
jgi:Ca-activated chloride channel homolog